MVASGQVFTLICEDVISCRATEHQKKRFVMLDNLIIVALYIAVPATILTVAFIAVLRKEEREIKEEKADKINEYKSKRR